MSFCLKTHVSSYLNDRLHLELNEDVRIGQIADGFTFLGLTLSKNGITVSDEKLKELQSKISNIIFMNGYLDSGYLRSLEGIRRYYAVLLPVSYSDIFDDMLVSAFSDYTSSSSMTSSQWRNLIGQLSPFNPNKTMKELFNAVNLRFSGVHHSINEGKINKKQIASRKLEYRRREMKIRKSSFLLQDISSV